MSQFDKSKSCQNCPERSIYPNCHSYCQEYIKRVAAIKERNQRERIARIRNGEVITYLKDSCKRNMKGRHGSH